MGPGEGCVRGLLQYSAGEGHPYLFHHAVCFGHHLMKPGLLRRCLFPVIGRQGAPPKCYVAQQVIPQGSGFLGPDMNYSGGRTLIRQVDMDRDSHSSC
jgi:hypothetical protein